MTFDDIEQVDPELAEDGRSIMFYGHTPDDDQTFTWSISLPIPITENAFLVSEWREVGWLYFKARG
ncbi:hypothetical protein M728_001103 [Ensifer sp. WSM1721]|uniref:hypothetical protein n=1 Tax=Ensifer sp. WSM1721 TaxID=1041159 RepID=UPI00047AF0AA|nr:hypothetical protein [Ensifer sp. WSM1721]